MWMGIVVALAASIFVVTKPEVKSVASDTLANVQKVIDQIQLPGDTNGNSNEKPNPDDPKWVVKGDYAINGSYVGDDKGNYVIYAKDTSKPITFESKISEDGGSATATDPITKGNTKLVTVEFMDTVQPLSSSEQFFEGDSNLEEIKGLDKFDMSKATSLMRWFADTPKLTSLDLHTWDISHVTNFNGMVTGATGLKELNISGWQWKGLVTDADGNESELTNNMSMGNPFGGNTSLTTIDMSNSAVRDMTGFGVGFFSNTATPALEHLNLKNSDFSRTHDLSNMFLNNTTIQDVDVTGIKKAPKQYDNGVLGKTDVKTTNMTKGMTNTDLATKLQTAFVEN